MEAIGGYFSTTDSFTPSIPASIQTAAFHGTEARHPGMREICLAPAGDHISHSLQGLSGEERQTSPQLRRFHNNDEWEQDQ